MVWSENFHFKPFPDSRAKRDRGQDRRSTSNHTQIATNPDHASNPDRRSTLPFDFDFESHPDHTLRLRRRTQRPGSHTFDFADFARLRLRRDRTPGLHVFDFTDFAPFDFVDFAHLRSWLRNGWVLMNLTGFDEFFLVGFWWIWPDLCLSIEKWYYIFVWKLRKCEK